MFKGIAHTIVSTSPRDPYRYSYELNTAYIDIEIDFYREIYNEWDFSPFTNRDIDADLLRYLEECASEINGKYKIGIVFHIPEALKDGEKEEKSKNGFTNYFAYEIRKIENKRVSAIRRAVSFGFYGLVLLFVGTLASNYILSREDIAWLEFLAEGFDIGGWVFIWELFSIVFFDVGEYKDRRSNLKRLRDAEIVFNYR